MGRYVLVQSAHFVPLQLPLSGRAPARKDGAVAPWAILRRQRLAIALALAALGAFASRQGTAALAVEATPPASGVAAGAGNATAAGVQNALGLFSKGLSVCVVAGAMLGKLPQVHMIWKAKSSKGVSFVSMWTEVFSMGVQFAYNVVRKTPLSTYAEVPILYVQLLLLCTVAAWADGYLGPRVWSLCLAITLVTVAMAMKFVPVAITLAMYTANAALGLLIFLPQVIANARNRSTGQLSFVVTVMTFSGSTTRLFTTLVEVDDLPLRLTMSINWLLTAILVGQFWVYKPWENVAVTVKQSADERAEIGDEERFNERRRPSQVATIALKHSVAYLSTVGSARCLTELVQVETVVQYSMAGMPNLGSLPSMSFFLDRSALSGDLGFQRSSTAPVQSLSEFDAASKQQNLKATMHRGNTIHQNDN